MRAIVVAASVLLSVAASRPMAIAQTSRPTSQPASGPASLAYNGDFEIAAGSGDLPAGWTSKRPDNVNLVDAGAPQDLVVEMTGSQKLMASYGVDLTSRKIAVKPNTRYRCTGLTRSDGPRMKIFVKGYATVTRSVDGELKTFDDFVYQMRKDIEPTEDWEPFNLDFELIPARLFSDHQHKVEHLRITLWAYWPVGTCWFDDIRFEEVGPVAADKRRHHRAVTHTGVKARLGEAAKQSERATDETFDEQQIWRAAVNAFRSDDHRRAAQLAERLIAHAPHNGAYRVLAARALAALQRWDAAERQARWLLEQVEKKAADEAPPRQIEPWQRDWARLVQAQVRRHAGRTPEARTILKKLLQQDVSPHARAAAEALLAEMEDADP